MSAIVPQPLIVGAPFPAWSPQIATPHTPVINVVSGADRTDTQPIAESAVSVGGDHAHLWGADLLWERVHVIPGAIDMGFVLARRTDEVVVWNAYTGQSRALEAIDHVGAEGVLIAAGSLPVTMEPYKAHIVTLITELEGPPNLNATLSYLFDNATAVDQHLTGTRTFGFPFRPQAGLKEVLEWLTDVQEAYSGQEIRSALRIAPRQSYTGEYLEKDPDDMAALKAVLLGWQRRYFGLPVWTEARTIGPVPPGSEWIGVDTAYASFKDGGFAMLHDGGNWRTARIVQILTVAPDGLHLALPTAVGFAGTTIVMPVRIARIDGDPSHNEHARHNHHTITFAVEDNDPVDAPASAVQYKGRDVWLTPYKVASHIAPREYLRPAEVIDGATGKVVVDPRTTWGRVAAHNAIFDARSRAGAWALRQWLYRRGGRFRSLWVPTFAADVRIVAPFTAADTVLVVLNNRYRDMLYNNPQCRHIAISRKNGDVLLREILTAQMVGEDTEWLGIDAAIGFDGTMEGDIRRISFLSLNRLSADRVEIHWRRVGVCAATVGLTGIDHGPEVS